MVKLNLFFDNIYVSNCLDDVLLSFDNFTKRGAAFSQQ